MKAVVFDHFGSVEDLVYREINDPSVGPDGVLVQVKSSSINPVDLKIISGKLSDSYSVWFPAVPGWDLAGKVIRVGAAVTEFVPGDEVIGYVRQSVVHHGTYAEKISVPADMLSFKPRELSWPEAGALPLIGLTAYQALFHVLKLRKNETILIHGVSGSLGKVCVQLANYLGANVIGTCNPRNMEKMSSLGCYPISYTENIMKHLNKTLSRGVDAILGIVDTPVVRHSTCFLCATGRVASVIDPGVIDWPGSYIAVTANKADLNEVARLAGEKILVPEIDHSIKLEHVVETLKLIDQGKTGKTVIYPI